MHRKMKTKNTNAITLDRRRVIDTCGGGKVASKIRFYLLERARVSSLHPLMNVIHQSDIWYVCDTQLARYMLRLDAVFEQAGGLDSVNRFYLIY